MKKLFTIISFLSFISFFSFAQNRHAQILGVRPQPILISDSGVVISSPDTTQQLLLDSTLNVERPKSMRNPTELDTLLNQLKEKLTSPDFYKIEIDTTIETVSIPRYFFRPAVFCGYTPDLNPDTISITPKKDATDAKYYNWLSREIALNNRMEKVKLYYIIHNPDKVKYNINTLPKAPKRYYAKIDPRDLKITIENQDVKNISNEMEEVKIERINWLRSFNGALQFSQAYISPNWYQGGNNTLNMFFNSEYNVKLNEAFYPNILFETNVKYKLVMNSAPEDTIRNYSISDDVFQVNSKFGLRAAKNWFYSVQAQLKTQLLNGYNTNSHDLKAAFLSPGELNVGLGMTYNYTNKKKTFSFDASVSPLSYNLKTCINSRMDETTFDIKEGDKTASQYGSSGEGKLKWKIAHNITFASRLFAFSDYEYFQGDLENTLSFSINRFLSTQINVNLRYDTSTPRIDDRKWHKLQVKEILSFGFSYQLQNI